MLLPSSPSPSFQVTNLPLTALGPAPYVRLSTPALARSPRHQLLTRCSSLLIGLLTSSLSPSNPVHQSVSDINDRFPSVFYINPSYSGGTWQSGNSLPCWTSMHLSSLHILVFPTSNSYLSLRFSSGIMSSEKSFPTSTTLGLCL